MPKAILCGHSIHYQQIGRGPDLMLVHGLFCNIAFWWFSMALPLAEFFRVTALDLRGHGMSALSPRGYRAIDLADDVMAVMDHLDIRRAHLVGHSFGGAVALAAAARQPDRISRVTLADAWVPALQPNAALAGGSQWVEVQRRLGERGLRVDNRVPRVARGFLEELLEADDGVEGAGAATAAFLRSVLPRSTRPGRPPRALRRWRELMERTSAFDEFHDQAGLGPEEIRGVTRPVRLVYGQRSRYRQTSEALRRLLPDVEALTVGDAGHYFPLFRPRALLDTLQPAPPSPGHELLPRLVRGSHAPG